MEVSTALLFGSAFGIASLKIPGSNASTTPHHLMRWHQESLLDAVGSVYGSDGGLERVARQQWIAACVAAISMGIMCAISPSVLLIIGSIFVVAAVWQLPLIIARSRENHRRLRIEAQLNDSLGELVMGVEAGMTLESVMNVYARRRVTDLATEFNHLLSQINIGVSRSDALEEMSQRTPTPGVRMFVAAIQQNQKLGTPLAITLRQQASSSRRRRRQRAEERAARLSLKMIFPTVFCILPVLLIVVVGPAIVRLVHALPQ